MKDSNKWIVTVFIMTFILSIVFNGVSNALLSKINIVIAFLILIIMIGIGIFFDMIGMAVATCEEAPFHAKAAKKHKGAREAIRLIRSKEKVSSVCNDVVGDVSGIVSGSLSALISVNLSDITGINSLIISLIVGGIVASLTVGGKAIGKKKAIDNCNEILFFVGGVVHLFSPIKANNTVDKKAKVKKDK